MGEEYEPIEMPRPLETTTLLLALIVRLSTVSSEDPWFGVDVQSSQDKNYSVRIRANPGDNLHILVDQFYQQHGHQFERREADFQALLGTLEEAQGGKCDACNTLVEMLTAYFQELGIKHAKQVGHDMYGKPAREMHIGNDMEKMVGLICSSDKYNPYGFHIRQGCNNMLADERAPLALRKFQGGTLRPSDTVERKQHICVQLYDVCPMKPINGTRRSDITTCRACGESMMDLHYSLRRSGRPWVPVATPASRMSRKHIISELEELCVDTEHRHPPVHVDEIREYCEQLVEDYTDEIVRAFVAQPETGQSNPAPVKQVCVAVTQACAPEEFEQVFPLLRHTQVYRHKETDKPSEDNSQSKQEASKVAPEQGVPDL